MDNEVKVAKCLGFLKGLISSEDYYVLVKVSSIKEFISEMEKK